MNRLLSLFFERRGYDAAFFDEIEQCNHPEPAHIDEMCDMLRKYHDEGTQIALLTDFDMDGLMSGVVGYAGLKELGFNVVLAYPDVTTGYGFDAAEIDRIKKQHPEAAVLMTGDVGITAYDGVARARALGMDVLVTDHHIPKAESVNANVIVDPYLPDDPAYSGICGAHVMYLVLRHYAERYAADPEFACNQIDRLRVFAGFGTISDSMPVLYENRRVIKETFSICRIIYNNDYKEQVLSIPGCEAYRRAFIGLYIMLSTLIRKGKINIDTINEESVGFQIAPAFNCIKRLNKEVSIAYSVFFGTQEEAQENMNLLIELNETRKSLVEDIYDKMIADPSPYAPFLYVVDTVPGLCGLLAQKVCDDTGDPAVVVIRGENGYMGSGRSPKWYPFLSDTTEFGRQNGWIPAGHEEAFGISFDDDEALGKYVKFIQSEVEAKKPAVPDEKPDIIISTLKDGDTGIDTELFDDFLFELDEYRPFGTDFEEPKVLLRFHPRNSDWSLTKGNKHVKVGLNGLELMCFYQGKSFDGKIDSDRFPEIIEVMGSLGINHFNNRDTHQLKGKLPKDVISTYQNV